MLSNSITTSTKTPDEQIAMFIERMEQLENQVTDLTRKNQALESKVEKLEATIANAAHLSESSSILVPTLNSEQVSQLRRISTDLAENIQTRNLNLLAGSLKELLDLANNNFVSFTAQLFVALSPSDFSDLMKLCYQSAHINKKQDNSITKDSIELIEQTESISKNKTGPQVLEDTNIDLLSLAQEIKNTITKQLSLILKVVLEEKNKNGIKEQGDLRFFIISQSGCEISENALSNIMTKTEADDFFNSFSKADADYIFINEQGELSIRALELFINLFKLYVSPSSIVSDDTLSQLNFCLTTSMSPEEKAQIDWNRYLEKLVKFQPDIQIKIIDNHCVNRYSVEMANPELAVNYLNSSENFMRTIYDLVQNNNQIIQENKNTIGYLVTQLLELIFSVHHILYLQRYDLDMRYFHQLVRVVSSQLNTVRQLGLDERTVTTCNLLCNPTPDNNISRIIANFGYQNFYFMLIHRIESTAVKAQLIILVLSSPYSDWFKQEKLEKLFKSFGANNPMFTLVFQLLLANSQTRNRVTKLFSSEITIARLGLNQAPDFSIIKLVLNGNFKFDYCTLKFDRTTKTDYQQMLRWLEHNDPKNCEQLNDLRSELENVKIENKTLSLENLLNQSVIAANNIKNNIRNPGPKGKRAVFCLYVMIYAQMKLHPLSYPVISGVGVVGEEISVSSYSDYVANNIGTELGQMYSAKTDTAPDMSAGLYGLRSRSSSRESEEILKTAGCPTVECS